MNLCRFTGWIPFEPETRYTPAGRKIICFAAKVRDDHGSESLLHFQLDADPRAPLPAELKPGHAVDIAAEAVAQVYKRPDGKRGSRTIFHVVRMLGLRRDHVGEAPGQLMLAF